MYKFIVFETKSNDWNWHLQYNGKNMAGGLEGPGGFASQRIAIKNLQHTARVFLACAGLLMNTDDWDVGEHLVGRLDSGVEIKLVIEAGS